MQYFLKGINASAAEIVNYDFIIRKEHKFLQRKSWNALKKKKTLGSYYDAFQKFHKIYILLENAWNKDNGFGEVFDKDL